MNEPFRAAITMTGIDARTSVDCLPSGFEVGILYTKNPEGRNRYPTRSKIAHLLGELSSRATALHVCGRGARQQLLDYTIPDLTHGVQRIQVNGEISMDNLNQLCDMYGDHTIITQHVGNNKWLLDCKHLNHAILVDNSGGRGIIPDEWVRPITNKRVGFAGGIGAENVVHEIDRIKPIANGSAWVDMESKLRDDGDWFDVNVAHAVMFATQYLVY